jgi:hypothetical protein
LCGSPHKLNSTDTGAPPKASIHIFTSRLFNLEAPAYSQQPESKKKDSDSGDKEVKRY